MWLSCPLLFCSLRYRLATACKIDFSVKTQQKDTRSNAHQERDELFVPNEIDLS